MVSRGDEPNKIYQRLEIDNSLFKEVSQEADIIFNNNTELTDEKIERLIEAIKVAKEFKEKRGASIFKIYI